MSNQISCLNNTALERAKEQAQRSGLFAMADDLAQMRDTIETPINSAKLTSAGASAETNTTKRLTSEFKSKSASLDSAPVSQSTAKASKLAQRELVALAAKESNEITDLNSELSDPDIENSNEQSQQRTIESIRKTLDKTKVHFIPFTVARCVQTYHWKVRLEC